MYENLNTLTFRERELVRNVMYSRSGTRKEHTVHWEMILSSKMLHYRKGYLEERATFQFNETNKITL